MFKIDEVIKAASGRLLSRGRRADFTGISTDSRRIKTGDIFIAIKGDNFDGHDFISEAIEKGAGCVICKRVTGSAGQQATRNKVAIIEVDDTVKSLGDIARHHRMKFSIPVIALTGSNGKTTTKDMIAWVLSGNFKVLKNEGTKNNQIGVPLTLLKLSPIYDIAVLELGTNHFGEIKYLAGISSAHVGIITNIGAAHLEHLRNLRGVLREKYALIENLQKPCIFLLNKDDKLLAEKIASKRRRPFVLSFSLKPESDFFASRIKDCCGSVEFFLNNKYRVKLKALGAHNVYNALAAASVARIFGVEYKDIASRLSGFIFPPGRLKLLNLNQAKLIDDTYNANPQSWACALEALKHFKAKGRKILVMGDMLELGEKKELFHRRAGRDAAGACDILVAVGKLSNLAASSARDCGLAKRNIFRCSSSLQARDILINKISPAKEDVILVKGSRLMKMEEVLT